MIDLALTSLKFLFGCVGIFTRLSPTETRVHKAQSSRHVLGLHYSSFNIKMYISKKVQWDLSYAGAG